MSKQMVLVKQGAVIQYIISIRHKWKKSIKWEEITWQAYDSFRANQSVNQHLYKKASRLEEDQVIKSTKTILEKTANENKLSNKDIWKKISSTWYTFLGQFNVGCYLGEVEWFRVKWQLWVFLIIIHWIFLMLIGPSLMTVRFVVYVGSDREEISVYQLQKLANWKLSRQMTVKMMMNIN